MAGFSTKPKVWPSQKAIFADWDNVSSTSLLNGSPPLGMSASLMAARSRRYFPSRPQTTDSTDPILSGKHSPSTWSTRLAKIPYRKNPIGSGISPLDKGFSNFKPSLDLSFKEVEEDFSKYLPHKSFAPKLEDYDKLLAKSVEDRELIRTLCAQALKKRSKALNYYDFWNNALKADSKSRIDNYDPKAFRGPLSDLILKLVTERQDKMGKSARNRGVVEPTAEMKFKSKNLEHKSRSGLVKNHKKKKVVPVYCMGGYTVLGELMNGGMYRNTFGAMSELKPKELDPDGFKRYEVLVDVCGCKDGDLLIHSIGKCLRFDGYAHAECPDGGRRRRRMTEKVKLPEGVYPDKLFMARAEDGPIILQETWNFSQ